MPPSASIAISADNDHWFLINASPDLRQQVISTPQLHPKADQLRHSPISGVILTNGEVDAVAGLLSLREGWPFTIYAHQRVLSTLKDLVATGDKVNLVQCSLLFLFFVCLFLFLFRLVYYDAVASLPRSSSNSRCITGACARFHN